MRAGIRKEKSRNKNHKGNEINQERRTKYRNEERLRKYRERNENIGKEHLPENFTNVN